ncbi:DIS3-like exonuclease 1 [Lingula anatina]|uniref:DIS3-like exonuclease 1 n=1 Tax=Lingula anatina TaxID=7574 RepID=A0A1S3GYI5_LINAN|nr:DIS3-like exonuclease 1 [Lingula anatina]XP_013378725.1 DIS3-like exonuclease 1 [Lingula anatina]XP_013378726.1 DIS3-like exonuclease 1 [Lingula anatina]XP_013378727.1 DIS3-like exonuclease 1 [Lingula anatina]XP_013378728.1 DIS3-like exonuclease 1 [Lingula anatina]|eukprot:XP_013378724.1 DIS3-like exonuclease 1 [Lingula anatina]
MQKTQKLLRVKNKLGRTLCVVREHYIREDVPCHSPLCLAGCQNLNTTGKTNNSLAQDVIHYMVPDADVARDYLEILEMPEFRGIVFMQTVVNNVQSVGGRRCHQRLKNIVKDGRKGSCVFYNEYQQYCYCAREPGEPLKKWLVRSTYGAVEWYFNHLAGTMPLVIITQDPQMIAEYSAKTINIFVMTMEDYLSTFWPNLTAALTLVESLTAALKEKEAEGQGYSGYLPAEVLEAGIKAGRFVRGCLQVNRHNAQNEAFVRREGMGSKKDDRESDILIFGMTARNRSIHGDIVVVEILPRNKWKGKCLAIKEEEQGLKKEEESNEQQSVVMTTGQVVGIEQRNWKDYVASFQAQEQDGSNSQMHSGKHLVIPYDYRIPKIRISTSQAEALKDHRIVVRIDSWDSDSQYPNGHFVRKLGKIGDLETEIAALLVQNNISVGAFPDNQLKELPSNSPENPWCMTEAEISRRRDLRTTHLVFSIDPKGCEDVDDTLSVRTLENGNIELGVHIADVTHFVKPGSLNDLEAQARSTSVYLADRRYDMLPAILSADLCSLLGSVDRYAVSVIWELSPSYEVLDVWYGRTVIRSSYKLFYEMAQAIHDGASISEIVQEVPELQGLDNSEVEKRIQELHWAIDKLMDIARQLRSRRLHSGGLELEGVEVKVQLDDTKQIEKLIMKQPLEIHETIAECMIYANHWVAKKIVDSFPSQSLLRHHPLPRQEDFENLVNCAKAKGFDVQTHSNKALAESLDKCVDPQDPSVNKLLRTLATQAMSNAQYFSTGSLPRDQFFHYGLALDKYTHFTSPIRRYADILVHRTLLAALGQEDASCLMSNKDLEELAHHINDKHRAAQYAERESQELFQALYFKNRPEKDSYCIADAVIFQLRANGVMVFVPKYGMRGPVYLKNKEGLVAHVSSEGQLEWTSGNLTRSEYQVLVNSCLGTQSYKLLSHITVCISVQTSHAHASSVKFDLVNNCPLITETAEGEAIVKRTDMIKDVQEAAPDSAESDVGELGPNFQQLRAQYGQTPSDHSLYHLLLSFKEDSLKLDT